MLKVRNLNKSFGDKVILNDISFDVNKGETVAIIGPSGSGKSTTLRCINLLEKPDSGSLTLAGKTYDYAALSKQDISNIRKSTAMVFQNFSLYENKTAIQNITLPLIKGKGYSKKDATEEALKQLEKVGLTEWKDH